MKTIHPFPARMAPDTITKWLQDLPTASKILDPMCGSGVVIRQALLNHHQACGLDIDPLAVLMTQVWTRKVSYPNVYNHAVSIVESMEKLRVKDCQLPWIDNCYETKKFIDYWFAEPQKSDLRKIAFLLLNRPNGRSKHANDLLKLALSRIIITKHVGASLAWDVSHSRPHKVREENDFDVGAGFLKSVKAISSALAADPVPHSGKIYRGDSRTTKRISDAGMDAIFTSPPYLNAIDYMRGHKFSLIWMGFRIPQLRQLRSSAIGTERGIEPSASNTIDWKLIVKKNPEINKLCPRQQRIIARYAEDAALLLLEFKRVLKPRGRLVLVLGDCTIQGQFIRNSQIYSLAAKSAGFDMTEEAIRHLNISKRYLPIKSSNNTLEKRMRDEIIQVYSA